MRAALIPPKGYYWTATQYSDYHLALAQILDEEYRLTYSTTTFNYDFIIIDNGAAEGNAVDDETLLYRAAQIGANEIVLPDVMKDMKGTIDRVTQFLHANAFIDENLMGVVQGTTMTEVEACIAFYVTNHRINTLGIPRHLITTLGDEHARTHILQHIQDKYFEMPVHLLGTNTEWKEEVRDVALTFPWVRGVDSSMPYNYTLAGVDLNDAGVINRPEGYFERTWVVDEELLESNILTFKEWARGESTRS